MSPVYSVQLHQALPSWHYRIPILCIDYISQNYFSVNSLCTYVSVIYITWSTSESAHTQTEACQSLWCTQSAQTGYDSPSTLSLRWLVTLTCSQTLTSSMKTQRENLVHFHVTQTYDAYSPTQVFSPKCWSLALRLRGKAPVKLITCKVWRSGTLWTVFCNLFGLTFFLEILQNKLFIPGLLSSLASKWALTKLLGTTPSPRGGLIAKGHIRKSPASMLELLLIELSTNGDFYHAMSMCVCMPLVN